jgi:uncharacterized membrane protein
MNFDAFLAASMVIQAHAFAAILALMIGITVLLMTKGTVAHSTLGRIWAGLMLLVAGSSFWITSIYPGHFSWIHILSIVTLISIPMAVLARRRGDISGHARAMGFTFLGLFIAGGFTLIPGRLLGKVVFGW